MDRPAARPQADEGGERREVGCQSEETERRDAAVQVDLLNQPVSLGVMQQCFGVGAERPAGGAVLIRQTETAVHQPADKPAAPHRPISCLRQTKPTGAPQPGPSPTRRKRILVLNTGGGKRILLVMDDAHTQAAKPAAADGARTAGSLQMAAQTAEQRPHGAKDSVSRWSPQPTISLPPAVSGFVAPRLPRPPAQRTPAQLAPAARRKKSGSPSLLSSPPNGTLGESNAPLPLRTAPPTPQTAHLPPHAAQSSQPSAHPPGRNKILVMSVAGRKVLLVMNPSQQPLPRPQHRAAAARLCSSPPPSANHCPPRDHGAPRTPPFPPAPPPYVCEFCGLRYASIANIRQHRRRIHGAGGAFICRLCGKGLSCRWQLARHSLLHRGEKLYSCQVCARTFSHLGPLRQHRLRLHRRRSVTR